MGSRGAVARIVGGCKCPGQSVVAGGAARGGDARNRNGNVTAVVLGCRIQKRQILRALDCVVGRHKRELRCSGVDDGNQLHGLRDVALGVGGCERSRQQMLPQRHFKGQIVRHLHGDGRAVVSGHSHFKRNVVLTRQGQILGDRHKSGRRGVRDGHGLGRRSGISARIDCGVNDIQLVHTCAWCPHGVNAQFPADRGAVVLRVEVGGTPDLVAFDGEDFVKHRSNDGRFSIPDGNDLLGIRHVATGIGYRESANQIVVRGTFAKEGVCGCGDLEGGAIVSGDSVFQHGPFVTREGGVCRNVREEGQVVVCDRHGLDLEGRVSAQVRGQKATLQNAFLRTVRGRQRIECGEGDVFLGGAVVGCGSRGVHKLTSTGQNHVRRQHDGRWSEVLHVDGLGARGGVPAKVFCGEGAVNGVFARTVPWLSDLLAFYDSERTIAGIGRCGWRESGADVTTEYRIGRHIQHGVNHVNHLHGLGVLAGQSTAVCGREGANAGELTWAISVDERFRHGEGCRAAIVCGEYSGQGIQLFEFHRTIQGVVVGKVLEERGSVVRDVNRALDLVKTLQVAYEKLHHGVVVRRADGRGFCTRRKLQSRHAEAPIDGAIDAS